MGAPTPSLPASFLSLPYEVRKRIYMFAGLIRECPVTIVPRSRGRTHPGSQELDPYVTCTYIHRKYSIGPWSPDDPDCVCPDFPKQLLLVCKSLHKEVQGVLYGENKFIVRAHHMHPDDLKVLTSLSIDAVRALRQLLVRLNSWPCIHGHTRTYMSDDEGGECATCTAPASLADPEILAGDEQSDRTIQTWKAICHCLSNANIPPGQLHLEFIADAGNLATAESILEPMGSLPRLKQCAVRLGREHDDALRSLARLTAARLMQETKETPLPARLSFSTLPREIRLHILWYTYLGPGGLSFPKPDTIYVAGGRFDQPDEDSEDLNLDFGLRRCCMRCSFTGLHCSCPLNFPAYNPLCQCRVLPLELFLVSRQMHEDAAETLYSTNIFQFTGSFAKTQSMLESIPKEFLKHIRRMKFPFSLQQTTEWGEYQSEWLSLLSFINKNGNPSNLLIIIETNYDYEYVLECDDEEESALRDLYATYTSIVRGIKAKMPGLQDLHLFLGVFHALEPVLERYVIGPGYDSKNGNRHSKAADSFDLYPGLSENLAAIPPWHKDL